MSFSFEWCVRACVLSSILFPVLIHFLYFKIEPLIRPLLQRLPNTEDSSWVEDIFKKVAEDGVKFCGCATAAFIVVGYGAKLLDTSHATMIYLACLSVFGFCGFTYARISRPGWAFRMFSFVGFIAHTAILVICSLHRFVEGKYQLWFVIGSAVYVCFCILGKWYLTTKEAEAKAKAELETTTVVQDEATKAKAEADAKVIEDEEKRLNQNAKDNVAFTTACGLGLFCFGEWGNFAEAYPQVFSLLALYNVGIFCSFYAARFLERGFFFKLLILFGSTLRIAMIPTGAGLFLLPGYHYTILVFTYICVTFVRWDLIDYAITWVLDRLGDPRN